MRVFYFLSNYISHRKAGVHNMECMAKAGCTLVDDPANADVVILHDEPPTYPLYFKHLPFLEQKHLIAYAVWETDRLPDLYVHALSRCREVWTCSAFAAEIFKRQGYQTEIVPHLVTAAPPHYESLKEVRTLISYDPALFYFYTIADTANPRKNIHAAVAAFLKIRPLCEGRARLIIKQYGKKLPYLSNIPDVIVIDQDLSDAHITALHATSHCYVSAHCSEAWGLSISDALAHGRTVVATGYSGNMEFMNENNSLPVAYKLRHLYPWEVAYQPLLLDETMCWASVDTDDLAAKMLAAVQGINTWGNAARDIVKTFGEVALIARFVSLCAARQGISV